MIFSLSLEEREPQTERTGVARHDSQVPKVGKDMDAPGTEEAHVARAESQGGE